MDRDEHTSTHTERAPAADTPPYEPPRVEDVETGQSPAETAAAADPVYLGAEESERWH